MRYYMPLGTTPDELAGGRPVEPGSFVDLDDDAAQEAHNARLISEGKLVAAPEPEKHEAHPRHTSARRARAEGGDS
jgi:hypothetical protein